MKTRRPKPSFSEEKQLWHNGYDYVIGMDEVGRGAFAGPLVAAAVIFSPCDVDCSERKSCFRCLDAVLQEVNDSKLLSVKKRERCAAFIKKTAVMYEIVEVPVEYINSHGIGKAGKRAFQELMEHFFKIIERPFVLVDAFSVETVPVTSQKAIIKGDQKSISIAAASIIAKVHRDRIMSELDSVYKEYGFALHKGYGTAFHRNAIKKFGLSEIHRTSFHLEKFL